jgi:hypothetical protein
MNRAHIVRQDMCGSFIEAKTVSVAMAKEEAGDSVLG